MHISDKSKFTTKLSRKVLGKQFITAVLILLILVRKLKDVKIGRCH